MKSKILSRTALAALAILGASTAYGQSTSFVTGLEPLPEAEYAKEPPKVRARSSTILSSVNLTKYFPRAGNQGQMGSCSAWAIVYAARSYYYSAITKKKPTTADEIASPSYVYNQTTTRPNELGYLCGGAYFKTALNILVNQGTVSLTDWPYTDKTCVPGTPSTYHQSIASKWKIPAYSAINYDSIKSIDAYRETLERGHPVIVGMKINTEEFSRIYGPGVYTLGPDSLNASGKHGYHAMVVVGYDDDKTAANGDVGAVRIMNSWSENWGDAGFVWVSYTAFLAMVNEAYLISGITPPMVPRDDVAPPPPKPDIKAEIEKIIADFKTGEMRIETQGDNYTIVGHGCIDEVRLMRKKLAQYGSKVQVLAEETPWPACEVRGILKEAISRGDLNASLTNIEADSPIVVRGVEVSDVDDNVSKTPVLRAGDKFKIDINTTEEAPFVQVYYLQADQTAKELYFGQVKKNSAGLHQLVIGAPPSNRRLAASAPFGTEAIMVLSGKSEILPIRIKSNFAEASFMDSIRANLANIVKNRTDIRASVIQVEVKDRADGAKSWLITENEFNSFGTFDTAPSSSKIANIGNSLGPKIAVLSPSLSGDITGQIAIKANFEAPSDAKIKPDSIRIKYRTPVAWFDVTDRVKASATVNASGISAKPMALPKGNHTIRIAVADTKNRESIVEINVKIK